MTDQELLVSTLREAGRIIGEIHLSRDRAMPAREGPVQ
jgi:hypothetical protein